MAQRFIVSDIAHSVHQPLVLSHAPLRDSDDDDSGGDSPCLADPQARSVRVLKSID